MTLKCLGLLVAAICCALVLYFVVGAFRGGTAATASIQGPPVIGFDLALAHEDTGQAAREFRTQLDVSRAKMLQFLSSKRKEKRGHAVEVVDAFYDLARERLQTRLQEAASEWQRVAMEAPPQRQEQMRTGLKALLDTLKDMKAMQEADREEVTRLSQKS